MELTAPNPLGVLHGLQTFLQLVRITPQGFAAPVVTIDDQPRFPWRGLMLDSGRHFMPLDVIEGNLDGMEAVKLNVFHWHISDDQGFRLESRTYPLLHGQGSNGLFYTQPQVAEVIDYARNRGIRVVPEFDMPCHTTSWLVGYPQLASGPGPYKIADQWGVMNSAMDPTRESTFQFLDKFLDEATALFPDAYFHIGGDECNGKEWNANQKIQAWMREHSIKDNAALQSYFSARLQKLVTAHHKIMEGWDEVLQADTPKDVVIQSWRGPKALAAAARQGNRGLLSNGYYIDLNQSAAYHYSIDPMSGDAAGLTPEEKARIIGGEPTMWSEFVTPENIDSRIWPRTAAIAERLWSPQEVHDIDSMYARMAVISDHLVFYGLHHQSSMRVMLQRMTGENDPEYLEVLAGIVQPPEEYQREDLKPYDTSEPVKPAGGCRSAGERNGAAVPRDGQAHRCRPSLARRLAAGPHVAGAMARQRRQASTHAAAVGDYRRTRAALARCRTGGHDRPARPGRPRKPPARKFRPDRKQHAVAQDGREARSRPAGHAHPAGRSAVTSHGPAPRTLTCHPEQTFVRFRATGGTEEPAFGTVHNSPASTVAAAPRPRQQRGKAKHHQREHHAFDHHRASRNGSAPRAR